MHLKAMNSRSDFNQCPWMGIAFDQEGLRELPDPREHPLIWEFLSLVGEAKDDEKAWCAAYVHWCMDKVHIRGMGSHARDWLDWGIRLERPTWGCVTVLWRE